MMRALLALAFLLAACTVAAPTHVVRVSIGPDWATSYDEILIHGVDLLDATGWQWTVVPRGDDADVRIDHAVLDCSLDGRGGGFYASDPTRVLADPACSPGVLDLVVAHELLHWAGCDHVPERGHVLSPDLENAPGCDPDVQFCMPTGLSPVDLIEFERATEGR